MTLNSSPTRFNNVFVKQNYIEGITKLHNMSLQPFQTDLPRKRLLHSEIKYEGKQSSNSEDWDVVVNLCPVALSHTLADPDDVPALLLLQLEEGVEHTEVELLHEGVLVQPHLLLKELVLEGLLARVGAGALEALLVLAVVLGHLPHLVIVISPGKSLEAVREESSTCWVELLSVVLGQLGPEGVDRDDERPPVSLKGENLAHDVRSFAANVQTEVVEGLKVGLVKGVPDYLDIHLVQILLIDARFEEGGKGSIDEHGIVQLGRGAGNVDCLHLLKAAQWMTLTHQLGYWPLMQCAGDQKNNVVNHVTVRDIVEEARKRAGRVVAHVLELGHQLVPQLLVNNRHLQSAFTGEEVSIVCRLEVELQVFQCLALHQVQVVILTEHTVLESPTQALQVPVVYIEHHPLHVEASLVDS